MGTFNTGGKTVKSNFANKNLLRNWYFVGGGSQQGGQQFPINSRGETIYSGAGTAINGWSQPASRGTTSVEADSIYIKNINNDGAHFLTQTIDTPVNEGDVTFSALVKGNPGYIYINNVNASSEQSDNWQLIAVTYHIGTPVTSVGFYIFKDLGVYVKAAKLELGDTQTLAHQDENGNWVLNELPDFEEELIKCQTSKANSADTYASKDLATQQMLATVERTATASKHYDPGEYLCLNGLLYRVTVAIELGNPINSTNTVSTVLAPDTTARRFTGWIVRDYIPGEGETVGYCIFIPMDTAYIRKYANASVAADISSIVIPNIADITGYSTGISFKANGMYITNSYESLASYLGRAVNIRFVK